MSPDIKNQVNDLMSLTKEVLCESKLPMSNLDLVILCFGLLRHLSPISQSRRREHPGCQVLLSYTAMNDWCC